MGIFLFEWSLCGIKHQHEFQFSICSAWTRSFSCRRMAFESSTYRWLESNHFLNTVLINYNYILLVFSVLNISVLTSATNLLAYGKRTCQLQYLKCSLVQQSSISLQVHHSLNILSKSRNIVLILKWMMQNVAWKYYKRWKGRGLDASGWLTAENNSVPAETKNLLCFLIL